MKRIFNRKVLMRLEMIVLITIVLIVLTIAWFAQQGSAHVESLAFQAYKDDLIKVALEPGGPDVQTLTGAERYADINLPDFYDMPEEMMAPGVYGKVTLYITSLSPVVNSCNIYFDRVPEFLTSVSANSAKEEEIKNLLEGHLLFYKEYNEASGYTGMITENEPLTVALEESVEVPVTIYWMWPYEYTNVPLESRNLREEAFFDMDKYQQEYAELYSEDDYISFYDYGDTKIGLSVKNIHFYAYVNTLKED